MSSEENKVESSFKYGEELLGPDNEDYIDLHTFSESLVESFRNKNALKGVIIRETKEPKKVILGKNDEYIIYLCDDFVKLVRTADISETVFVIQESDRVYDTIGTSFRDNSLGVSYYAGGKTFVKIYDLNTLTERCTLESPSTD